MHVGAWTGLDPITFLFAIFLKNFYSEQPSTSINFLISFSARLCSFLHDSDTPKIEAMRLAPLLNVTRPRRITDLISFELKFLEINSSTGRAESVKASRNYIEFITFD